MQLDQNAIEAMRSGMAPAATQGYDTATRSYLQRLADNVLGTTEVFTREEPSNLQIDEYAAMMN